MIQASWRAVLRKGVLAAAAAASVLAGCASVPYSLFPGIVSTSLPADAVVFRGDEPGIVMPEWLVRPDPNAFPEAAIGRGIRNGWADLSCFVTPSGLLTQCRVAAESEAGAQFGLAALDAARVARLRPASLNGEAVYVPVRYRHHFTLGR